MPSLGRVLERLTVAVDADTSEADRKLNDLGDESKGGSWMGKLTGASSKLGAAMAFGVGGGIAALGGLGIAAAAQAEQSEIAFTSIMGDAGKAKSFLADLSQFAAATPFELPGLKDAASRLLATGTEASRVIPIMRAVGDSTSAMGTGAEGIDRAVTALTQMQVKGKITGEEMLQLAEAGVPAWDALATVMGVSVAEAQKKVSAGQGNVNDLFKALETQAGPAMGRVKGMMDAQSNSAMGMLSTLKDTATQGLGDMMKPALVEIKRMMPEITKTIGGTFTTVGPAIAGLVPPILELFKSLMGLVPGIVAGLSQILPVVSKMAGGFAKLLAAVPPGVILGIVAGFMALGPVVSIVTGLVAAVGFLISPVGLVVVAIAAVAAGLVYAYKHFETFRNVVDTVARFIGNNLQPILIGLGAALLVVLSPVAAVAAAAFLLWKNWERLPALFDQAITWIATTFQEFAPRVIAALAEWVPKIVVWWYGTALPAVGAAIWSGIQNLAGIWWDLVGFTLSNLVEYVPQLVAWWYGTVMPWLGEAMLTGLRNLAGLWVNLAQWAVGALANLVPALAGWWFGTALPWMIGAFGEGLRGVARIFANLPGQAVGALAGLVPALAGVAIAAMGAMANGIRSGVGSVMNVLAGLPGQIRSAVGDLSGVLFNAGRSILYGLIDGVQSQINSLRNVLGSVTNMIPNWKGPLDRDKTLLVANGAAVMGGFIKGIEGQRDSLRRTLGAVTGSVPSSAAASPTFASSGGVGGSGGAPVVVQPVVSLDGMTMSMSELKKRMRVLFIEDGGSNAFATAVG